MNYLITGATGFIGRYLVKELLTPVPGTKAPHTVFVLVRERPRARLAELFDFLGSCAAQVVPVGGDLTRRELGISAEDRVRLKGRIDHFFHLGAIYDLRASAEALHAANVAGTRHSLDLAAALEAGCFHLCSSIAVAGQYRGTFTEHMFEEAYGLEHPYFRTKHESEALVRQQARVPWRIYRPGMVVGHSQSGHITKVDGPYHLFKMLQVLRRNVPGWLPLIGIEGGYVNVVPIDYVVAAMAHLAHVPGQNGRCFHLTDPEPRHVGELLNLFARAGHAPLLGLRIDNKVLAALPRSLLESLQRHEPFRAIAAQLLDDLQLPGEVLKFLNLPTLFDNHDTRRLLEAGGIRLPTLEEYAWKLWDYWERHLDPDLSIDRSLSGAVRNKRVLITGGSSGIGRATALKLGTAGARVLIAARDRSKLDATRAQIEDLGGEAYAYVCDLTDQQACRDLVSAIDAEHGGVDILINNAGRSIRRSIGISYGRFHDYERLMQLNFFAAVRLTLALLPHMVKQGGGHVIMISSIGVLSNAPRFSAYVASKAALDAFARSASAEYREQGVHFTVVNLPLVRTPMSAATRAYDRLPAMTPEEAATMIADAVVRHPPRLVSRLGFFAQAMELFAPRMADVINASSFKMFPESAAARGDMSPEQPLGDDAVAFAELLEGLHW
ncbi:MAG: SDR family oxidoreductase [Steroidobacteraceae bacterium]